MMSKQYSRDQTGFTLVEVLATIVVAAIFIFAITQLYITQTRIASASNYFNTADLLAYNNLRTYAYGKGPTWFQCVYSGGNPQPMTVFNSTAAVSGLPSPVTQTVIATAPYGCGGGSSGIGYPIKVVSTVIYGPTGRKIVHATYSSY